jgi:hypothetical protein
MVEEEIIYLERKVEDLKLCLHRERKQNKEWNLLWWQRKQNNHFLCGLGAKKEIKKDQDMPLVPSLMWGEGFCDHGRKASFNNLALNKSISCADLIGIRTLELSSGPKNQKNKKTKNVILRIPKMVIELYFKKVIILLITLTKVEKNNIKDNDGFC